MGSCVSRSTASAAAAAELARTTAMVVGSGGTVARFVVPVTAHEALGAAASSSLFLSCSDELDFDAPPRAMAASDALLPGQLYFALPLPMLRRPLSARDMAELAVRASAALGATPLVSAVDVNDGGAGAGVSSRDKSGAATTEKQQRRRMARVTPLDVAGGGDESGHEDAAWKSRHVYGGEDAPKTVHGDRHPAAVQRLSVIVEGDNE